jgi:ribosomal protein L28
LHYYFWNAANLFAGFVMSSRFFLHNHCFMALLFLKCYITFITPLLGKGLSPAHQNHLSPAHQRPSLVMAYCRRTSLCIDGNTRYCRPSILVRRRFFSNIQKKSDLDRPI